MEGDITLYQPAYGTWGNTTHKLSTKLVKSVLQHKINDIGQF